jgi:hypothetical protein
MGVAIALFLAFNAGRPSAHGWGTVMSTDTAFALGLLALVGPRFSERLRAFMLTVVVVDDLVTLVIIATVYTATLHVVPLLAALGFYAAVLVARRFPMRPGLICIALGVGAWVSLLKSGVEPVVLGVAMGLLAYAFPAPRSNLERATERFREFREQPTAELARRSTSGYSRSFIPGRATSSSRSSRWRTRASRSMPASWPGRSRHRSRWGSSSAMWSENRSPSWARPGSSQR